MLQHTCLGGFLCFVVFLFFNNICRHQLLGFQGLACGDCNRERLFSCNTKLDTCTSCCRSWPQSPICVLAWRKTTIDVDIFTDDSPVNISQKQYLSFLSQRLILLQCRLALSNQTNIRNTCVTVTFNQYETSQFFIAPLAIPEVDANDNIALCLAWNQFGDWFHLHLLSFAALRDVFFHWSLLHPHKSELVPPPIIHPNQSWDHMFCFVVDKLQLSHQGCYCPLFDFCGS